MANKKIKKIKIGSTSYDVAVDGVDKVDGLEERLSKLEDERHSVDGTTLIIGESPDIPEAPGYADQALTSVLVGDTLYPIKDTKYTHPTYTSKAAGLYKVTVDGTGHVSATTAVTKADITGLGIPGSNTNTTYDLAASKSKTNGNVTIDLTAGGSGSGTDSVQIKGSGATTVTTDANGVITISSTDNNTVYTHPTYTAKESGLYKVAVDNTGHVSAATAVTKSDITGLGIPGSDTNTDRSSLAYCTTGASTAAKTATMPGFALSSGQYIFLRTTVANSATSSVTLNVNSTGAKPIKIGNSSTAPTASNFPAGDYLANYDGTNWVLTRIYFTDTDTYRSWSVNGTAVNGLSGTKDNVNLKAGSNVSITASGTDITIAATDTTYSAATTSKAGLMSAADKTNLDTIVTSFSSDDSNTTIDTIKEVLKAFENAPEGTNIANALAAKSNVGHTHEVTTSNAAPHSHTHTVTVSGTTGTNGGTVVKAVTGYGSFSGGSGSLTSDTTSTNGIKYVEAQGTFSAGTTPPKSASFSGTAATITPTVTLTGSLSGTCLTLSASVTGASYTPAGSVNLTAGTAPSMGSATTKYLHHSHSGASLGAASTSDVAPNGHAHSYGSSTALTTTGNSGTAIAAVTEVKADE